MSRLRSRKVFLLGLFVILFTIVAVKWRSFDEKTESSRKYVGFRMNTGRFGAQLFHLIAGYGIGRTLNRTHYLSLQDGPIVHVVKYLRQFKEVFPRLQETFVIAPYDADETRVAFSTACCKFDNPLRLYNNTSKYLFLMLKFGQHPKYFQDYIEDIRKFLQFSENVKQMGEKNFTAAWKTFNRDSMCIHTRRSDFVQLKVSTDMENAVKAATSIAQQKEANTVRKTVYVSNFSVPVDLYAASQLCTSFLITATTSTFGWWLAFFSKNQHNVFYMSDKRNLYDKVPRRELFLERWKDFSNQTS
ncbi:unnamed protein product [Cylicocyclus nassatus]|uniref:L-Fucosyltransferase n=1 Tax=Cylicocyclus nassatus TaxID=53992 RepID=A0AA36H2I7_CYLNA|nr:unnamed protein product [Cylicocyclus nassatus]